MASKVKLNPHILNALREAESFGLKWHVENRARHLGIVVEGRTCAVVTGSGTGSADASQNASLNVRAQIRNRVKEVLAERGLTIDKAPRIKRIKKKSRRRSLPDGLPKTLGQQLGYSVDEDYAAEVKARVLEEDEARAKKKKFWNKYRSFYKQL